MSDDPATAAGLAAARRELLAGDASTRAYERLHRTDGSTVIFMDQPPAAESAVCPPGASEAERLAMGYNAAARLAAGSVAAFVTTAAWLRDHGLSAPQILAHDVEAGLAVLEDLGDGLFATLIADGEAETPLYEAAVDVQIRLQETAPPDLLVAEGASWPLLTYDALTMTFRKIKIPRNPNCGICSDHPTITELIDYEQPACDLRHH